jgi:sugar/nucleoside kinase (ribokinase family)
MIVMGGSATSRAFSVGAAPTGLVCVSVLGVTRLRNTGTASTPLRALAGLGAQVAALSARAGRLVELVAPAVGQDRDGAVALADLRRAGVTHRIESVATVVTPWRDVRITPSGDCVLVGQRPPSADILSAVDVPPLRGAEQVFLDVDASTAPLSMPVLESLADPNGSRAGPVYRAEPRR